MLAIDRQGRILDFLAGAGSLTASEIEAAGMGRSSLFGLPRYARQNLPMALETPLTLCLPRYARQNLPMALETPLTLILLTPLMCVTFAHFAGGRGQVSVGKGGLGGWTHQSTARREGNPGFVSIWGHLLQFQSELIKSSLSRSSKNRARILDRISAGESSGSSRTFPR